MSEGDRGCVVNVVLIGTEGGRGCAEEFSFSY